MEETWTPDQVAAHRREKSLPVLKRIAQSLAEDAELYLPKTGMADAIGYARLQWSKLIAYVEHGQARIDNNLTEQAIRPPKLGMKNWLLIGHPSAG